MYKTSRRKFTGVYLIWLFVLNISIVQAQVRSEIDVQDWPDATVVLTSGETLSGPLTFYRTQEVINIHRPDGSISSFSPVNVSYFVVKGMPGGYKYTFLSLPWDMGKPYSDFRKPTFFEQLNSGPITLIMRESYVKRDVNQYGNTGRFGYYNPYYYGLPGNMWVNEVQELYYALLPDGKIVELRNVKKDLNQLFGKKTSQVKAFVKKNRLRYERPNEVVAIVNYFNSLQVTGRGASEPDTKAAGTN